jgi:predicted pyridoxine 5'-phosphate oxidase superfamily flavin-nucleotide-binding protein
MGERSVYHEGELAVQELAGERELAERHGAGIGSSVMRGAWSWLKRQKLVALATRAAGGQVWASVWFGAHGFVESRDDGQTLWIQRSKVAALEVDPVLEQLREGAALGVLAIELETRRRLRINGSVRALNDEALVLNVGEAFANCPKYISQRELFAVAGAAANGAPARGAELDEARQTTIRRSDTLFVGSLHPGRGADASHRGGEPGFVQVVDAQTLRIPDYAGNGMYQTLGNLHATGRAGMVFVDFEGRRLLHVTGATTLSFDERQLITGGTRRSWDLRVESWLEGALPGGVVSALVQRSCFNPKAGA